MNLLFAIMIYLWTQFYLVYNSLIGAIVAELLLGLLVVIGVWTVLVLRRHDKAHLHSGGGGGGGGRQNNNNHSNTSHTNGVNGNGSAKYSRSSSAGSVSGSVEIV